MPPRPTPARTTQILPDARNPTPGKHPAGRGGMRRSLSNWSLRQPRPRGGSPKVRAEACGFPGSIGCRGGARPRAKGGSRGVRVGSIFTPVWP